jgi:hypothetical protein
MQKGLVLLMVGIMTTTLFFNIGIVTKIFAQEIEEENSFSLSEQSIEEAQDNLTELTANKTGFEEEDTVGLSGRSIEEAKK